VYSGVYKDRIYIFDHGIYIFCTTSLTKCYIWISLSWVTPKMLQNFDMMYLKKIEKTHLVTNNEYISNFEK